MTIMKMSAMMMIMMMIIIIIITRPQIPGFWASKTERIEIKQKVSNEFYTALSNMLKNGID
jgi:FtsZ-interacting cell division protein ZipA